MGKWWVQNLREGKTSLAPPPVLFCSPLPLPVINDQSLMIDFPTGGGGGIRVIGLNGRQQLVGESR